MGKPISLEGSISLEGCTRRRRPAATAGKGTGTHVMFKLVMKKNLNNNLKRVPLYC